MAADRGSLYRLENGEGKAELLLSHSANVVSSHAHPTEMYFLTTAYPGITGIYNYGIKDSLFYFYLPGRNKPQLMFQGTNNHLYLGKTKNDTFVFIEMNCDSMPYNGDCGSNDSIDEGADRWVEEVFGLRVNWETKTSEVVNIVDSQKLSPVMQKYTYDEDQEKLILTSLDGAPLLTIDVASF